MFDQNILDYLEKKYCKGIRNLDVPEDFNFASFREMVADSNYYAILLMRKYPAITPGTLVDVKVGSRHVNRTCLETLNENLRVTHSNKVLEIMQVLYEDINNKDLHPTSNIATAINWVAMSHDVFKYVYCAGYNNHADMAAAFMEEMLSHVTSLTKEANTWAQLAIEAVRYHSDKTLDINNELYNLLIDADCLSKIDRYWVNSCYWLFYNDLPLSFTIYRELNKVNKLNKKHTSAIKLGTDYCDALIYDMLEGYIDF